MRHNSTLLKCALSSLVAVVICTSAAILPIGNVNAREAESGFGDLGHMMQSQTTQGQDPTDASAEIPNQRYSHLSVVQFANNSQQTAPSNDTGNDTNSQATDQGAQDDLPIVIHESDGTTWTQTDKVTNPDGTVSHIYTDNSDVQFDDGGLGDAELIIN